MIRRMPDAPQLQARTLLAGDDLSVLDVRCSAGPADGSPTERHRAFVLAYVRAGSFGYRTDGVAHQLVAGGFLVGAPGQDYVCTHEHGRGDSCLSLQLSAGLVDELGGTRAGAWQVGGLAPEAELGVLGALAQAAADGRTEVALEEAALLLVSRFLARARPRTPAWTARALDRRRAVEIALWMDSAAHEPLRLRELAARAGLSPFHFLRVFTRALGVTPHQYLVGARLRRAARLLADPARQVTDVAFEVGFGDLSNFVRTFRRAAGVSPRRFKRLAREERKFVQAMLAPAHAG